MKILRLIQSLILGIGVVVSSNAMKQKYEAVDTYGDIALQDLDDGQQPGQLLYDYLNKVEAAFFDDVIKHTKKSQRGALVLSFDGQAANTTSGSSTDMDIQVHTKTMTVDLRKNAVQRSIFYVVAINRGIDTFVQAMINLGWVDGHAFEQAMLLGRKNMVGMFIKKRKYLLIIGNNSLIRGITLALENNNAVLAATVLSSPVVSTYIENNSWVNLNSLKSATNYDQIRDLVMAIEKEQCCTLF